MIVKEVNIMFGTPYLFLLELILTFIYLFGEYICPPIRSLIYNNGMMKMTRSGQRYNTLRDISTGFENLNMYLKIWIGGNKISFWLSKKDMCDCKQRISVGYKLRSLCERELKNSVKV